MPALLDSGVLYALADVDDAWHGRCRDWLAAVGEPLLAPVTVLPEVTYLLRTRLGRHAEERFVEALALRELAVEPLTAADLARAVELLRSYPDLGFVDATVVATAERLDLAAIATTDRRHFTQVRPRHRPAFELLP